MQQAAMMSMMGDGASMSSAPSPGAAAAFIAMWTVMMVLMMLPSLWPTLRRYHHALAAICDSRPALQTALAASGYTGVWAGLGVMAFVVDSALAALAAHSPASADTMRLVGGGVVVAAGALQLTRWKRHHLAHCRDALRPTVTGRMSNLAAWRDGSRLGVHCTMSCMGPTAALLALGMTDTRVVAVITAVITAERVIPAGARIARATGAIALGTGGLVLARAIGLV